MDQDKIPSVAKAFSQCAEVLSALPSDEQRDAVLQLLKTLFDTMPQPRVSVPAQRLLPLGEAPISTAISNGITDEKIEMAIRFTFRDGGVLWERFLFAAIAMDQKEPGGWFTGADLNKYLSQYRASVRNVTNAVAPLVENRFLRQKKDGPFWNYSLTEQGIRYGMSKLEMYQ